MVACVFPESEREMVMIVGHQMEVFVVVNADNKRNVLH